MRLDKKAEDFVEIFRKMASPPGLEPGAPCLGGMCSIQLSYGDIYSNLFVATRYFRLFSHIQAEPPKFLRTLALAENLENPVAIRTRL